MSTMVGPQRHEYWAAYAINTFRGAPLCLGVWMSHARFNAILVALSFTDRDPPPFLDKFWEVCQMIEAWGGGGGGGGKHEQHVCPWLHELPGRVHERVDVNKFTCPGFMFVPCKPWPFGNEYHMVCCCLSGIMWGIDLVEGKDHPQQLCQLEYEELGSTVGLLLRMLFPIFHLGFVVILDSGFCGLKGIVELRKKGVFAGALIKKRRYWPKYIHGDEVKEHFNDKEVGDADSWGGKLEDVPFHVFAMKEPDYVMSLMSTYGTNARDGYKET